MAKTTGYKKNKLSVAQAQAIGRSLAVNSKPTLGTTPASNKLPTGGYKLPSGQSSSSLFKPSNAPSTKQQAYIQKVGFKPQSTPTFRSEAPKKGLLGHIFDLLDRPGSGIRTGISDLVAKDRASMVSDVKAGKSKATILGKALLRNFGRVLGGSGTFRSGFLRGAVGDQKTTGADLYSQVIDDPFLGNSKALDIARKPLVRAGVGLGTDIVTDPLTFIGLGEATKGLGLNKLVEPITNSIKKAPIFEEVMGRLSKTKFRPESFVADDIARETTSSLGTGLADDAFKLLRGEVDDATSKAAKGLTIRAQGLAGGKVEDLAKQVESSISAARNIKAGKDVIDQKEVFKYLTGHYDDVIDKAGKVTKPQGYNPLYDELVKPVRNVIDNVLSENIKKAGILPEDVLKEGQGNYLRFFYKKLGVEPAEQLQTLGSVKGGLKLGQEAGALQKRKTDLERVIESLAADTQQFPPEKVSEVLRDFGNMSDVSKASPEFKALETKVKDLVGGDTAFKDIALAKRQASGLVDEGSAVAAETIRQLNELTSKYSFLDNTAKTLAGDFADEAAAKAAGFLRVPESKAFGPLSGKYVPKWVQKDIVGIMQPNKSFLTKATNIWKQLKLFTPFNSATNFRNMASNMVLNSVVKDGLPAHRLDIYMQAAKDWEKGGKWWQEALENGLFQSGFLDSEVRKAITGNELSGIDKASNFVGNKLEKYSKSFGPGLGWGPKAFQQTEETGRLAQYIYQRSVMGKSPAQAVKTAEDALFNYSRLPVYLREVRDKFIPFLSFKYFSANLALDTLWNRTNKITNFLKSKNAIENLSSQNANEVDLPSYIKENRELNVRLPWLDGEGNPRYLDLTYMYPFGDIAGGYDPTSILLGNPFAREAVQQAENRDFYFDQEITRPGQTGSQALLDRVGHAFSNLGPKSPAVPFSREQRKVVDAFLGRPDQYGRTQDLPGALVDTFLGVKAKQVNPTEQSLLNQKELQRQINDINYELRRTNNNQSLSARRKENMVRDLNEKKQRLLGN